MFLALAMAMTMLFGSATSVFAADVTVDADSKTGTCESTFEVTEDMLGGGLVVSIPADMNLTFDEGTSTFAKEDYITVSGSIAATKQVDISLLKDYEWTLQESIGLATELKASGTMTLGDEEAYGKTSTAWGSEEKQVTSVTYTATEVRLSNDTPDQRPVKASVALADVPTIGNYTTEAYFLIEVVDAPTA